MSALPVVSGRDVAKALEKIGYVFDGQRGSHMILRRAEPYARVIIPDHKVLRVGTLRQILGEAGQADEMMNRAEDG